MAQIAFNNIDFTYSGRGDAVFTGFTVHFDSSWRLGLVARNGRGKTTLLNLLASTLQPGSGTIQVPAGLQPLIFPPSVDHTSPDTAKSIITKSMPALEPWRLLRELTQLAVAEALLERPFNTLSPGEQGKLLLAALFAQEHAYVLLDEPANHLDADGKQLLTTYLAGKQSFLLVSHERALLDAVTSHTLALLKSGPELVAGPYHVWAAHRQNIESFEHAENARLTKEITQLSAAAKQSGQWAEKAHRESTKSDSSGLKMGVKEKKRAKAAKLERRAKQVTRRKERSVQEKSQLLHNIETSPPLKMSPLIFHTETIVAAHDISLWYDTKMLLEATSFTIAQGERVCLRGQNGAGKSTLLKLIGGNTLPQALHSTGTLHTPKGLVISVLPQACTLPALPLTAYIHQTNTDTTKVLTLLKKMGFPREAFAADITHFSAGQQRKLLLAISICTPAHLYLWDEPLNYLDIQTREQIEGVLLAASPTLVFAEHDAYFCQKIATQTIMLPK